MKQLFRKLFGIKYTYFVVAEFRLDNILCRRSCTTERSNPLNGDDTIEFINRRRAEFLEMSPELKDYSFFILNISRL
jgi:hypothetical protein